MPELCDDRVSLWWDKMRLTVEVELDRQAAFDTVINDLVDGLARRGLRLGSGPDGRITQGEIEVGRVVAWEPGERASFEWHPASWQPDLVTQLELSFELAGEETRVTMEVRGWEAAAQDRGAELAGWFAGEAVASVLATMAPARYGDWLTDRRARRPFGVQGRDVYRDPIFHRPNFLVLLETLSLTPDDTLLEVGCGGGALLHDALAIGGAAAGAVTYC